MSVVEQQNNFYTCGQHNSAEMVVSNLRVSKFGVEKLPKWTVIIKGKKKLIVN
jgi:hypothetical protein